MARLKHLASQVGGQYSPWQAGTGGYAGVPFAYGAEHERFGVLNYTVHGMPIEIGHLSSQVSPRYRAPTGRRHAYLAGCSLRKWCSSFSRSDAGTTSRSRTSTSISSRARSVPAGSEHRWHEQRTLVEALAASMSDAAVWDLLRRPGRGHKSRYGDMRADLTRGVTIVVGVMVVLVVVLSITVVGGNELFG